jgi:hypothetical protein
MGAAPQDEANTPRRAATALGGERTRGWFGQSRRLSMESERLCETIEAVTDTTMTRLMLRRLAAA